jgi:oligoribonuclease
MSTAHKNSKKSKKTKTNKKYVCADVETSGLDENFDYLLEIAALISDTDLNLVDDIGYHADVYYSAEKVEQIKAQSDPYVVKMHTESGLWERLPQGKPMAQIAEELNAYIKKHAPEKRQARLLGNSVSLDKAFLNKNIPGLQDHLHYRVIDVSSIAEIAHEWWGVGWYEKQLRHEAMSDILESIAELKHIRQHVDIAPF